MPSLDEGAAERGEEQFHLSKLGLHCHGYIKHPVNYCSSREGAWEKDEGGGGEDKCLQ